MAKFSRTESTEENYDVYTCAEGRQRKTSAAKMAVNEVLLLALAFGHFDFAERSDQTMSVPP